MRPAFRWGLVGLVGLAWLALVPAGARAQEAASVLEVGWWTDNPAPNAPAGGFEVAMQPQGTLSEAAMRVNIAATSVTSATLVLGQASSLGNPALQVCPTASSWSAASPGKLADAPKPDCASPAPLTLNADQAVWTADVTRLLTGSQVSLMVVPKADPTLPLQVPFQVEFAKAEIQGDGTFDESLTEGSIDSGGIASSDTSFPDLGSGLGVDTSALAAPPETVPSLGEQAAAAPAQVPGRFPDQSASLKHTGSSKPWGRLPLLMILAGLIGAGTSFGRVQLRERGLLPT